MSFNALVQMLQKYMYMHIHTHLHTYTYIYIHTYIHKHTHIYTYTYTCALLQASFLNRHYIYRYDMVTTKGLLT